MTRRWGWYVGCGPSMGMIPPKGRQVWIYSDRDMHVPGGASGLPHISKIVNGNSELMIVV